MLDFVFPCGKYKWPFGYNFQNSILRYKNMNGRLVAVFKILCFVVKKRMTVWVQSSKICISLLKKKWLFGYNCKILYFPVKKHWPFWLHAFTQTAIHSLTTKYEIFKVASKQSRSFWQQIKKSKVASKLPFVFWRRNTKFEVIPKRPFVFLLKTTKIEL